MRIEAENAYAAAVRSNADTTSDTWPEDGTGAEIQCRRDDANRRRATAGNWSATSRHDDGVGREPE